MAKVSKLINLDSALVKDVEKYVKKNKPAVSNFTHAVQIALTKLIGEEQAK